MELTYEPTTNVLHLHVTPTEPVRTVVVPGQLDIGEAGRLLGLEITRTADTRSISLPPQIAQWGSVDEASIYLPFVPEPVARADRAARSVAVTLTLELDSDNQIVAVIVPRRGPGYEISYPSGNT